MFITQICERSQKYNWKYPGCAAINDAIEINKTSSVIYAINLEDVWAMVYGVVLLLFFILPFEPFIGNYVYSNTVCNNPNRNKRNNKISYCSSYWWRYAMVAWLGDASYFSSGNSNSCVLKWFKRDLWRNM